MKSPPTATQGASTVLVVLFTLLLLSGMLAATLRLSLVSRQNVADQASTVQAQYAAESNVSLARSRLEDIQALLAKESINVPVGTVATTIRNYAQQFCGNSDWNAFDTNQPTAVQCKVSRLDSSNQYQIFSAFVKPAAYAAILPAAEATGAGTTDWWAQQLGATYKYGNDQQGYSYTIVPTRVIQFTTSKFRFYVRLQSVKTIGGNTTSTRVLLGAPTTDNDEWWVDISLPPFLDNVLFTNHHRSKGSTTANIGFDAQKFNGPIHTNEKFLFYSGGKANFSTKVESSGCTNIDSLPANAITCNQAPGVYLGNSNNLYSQNVNSDKTTLNNNIKNAIVNYNGAVWNNMQAGYPDFKAEYRPMPTTADTQKADAQDKGLYLPNNVRSVDLKAGDGLGLSPTLYDPTTKKWVVEPLYQYITITDANSVKTEYRYGKDKVLYKKSTTGLWNVEKNDFNGVIFGDGNIGYTDTSGLKRGGLSGPARVLGNSPPALAPFAQMTVAGNKDINISGDLSMSETPLVCDEKAPDYQTCRDDANSRTNVLGIYTQNGDVDITKSAPNNLIIHAMTMSAKGEVAVDGYNNGSDRGNVKLVGGLVENYYGAFGTTAPTGYGRDFSYDRRFLDLPGFTPPSFPVSPKWTIDDASSLSKSLDSITWNQGTAGDY